MDQTEYREVYLRSDHWQAKRAEALLAAGKRCQVCNSGQRLDVHHRTYERLGNEDPGDLTVLCRDCHELFHARSTVQSRPRVKPKAKPSVNGHSAATKARAAVDLPARPRPVLLKPAEKAILRVLNDGVARSTRDVAEEAGYKLNKTGGHLSALRQKKRVTRIGKLWKLRGERVM